MSSSSFNRPGAIDLSQLAAEGAAARAGRTAGLAPAAATSSRSPSRPSRPRPSASRSSTRWSSSSTRRGSPRASSCRTRWSRSPTPATASSCWPGSTWTPHPGIVQALQLQAVPTVIALIGGQAAPLFQGVLPKDQVQAAIDQLLKAAVANGIVGRADPVGGAAAADPEEEAAPDLVSRPPTRRWSEATSRRPARSSTSCCRPTRRTPRRWPARRRRACSPGRQRSTRTPC